MWSIGLYTGPELKQIKQYGDGPILTPDDVTDFPCGDVADPFVVYDNGWHMFFEGTNYDFIMTSYESARGKGEICYASSKDGINWKYEGSVLREPFHLSYPNVFKYNGEYFMIPAKRVPELRVYIATDFPRKWKLHRIPFKKRGWFSADNSLLEKDGKLWLFLQCGGRANKRARAYSLSLFEFSIDKIKRHPSSPIATGPNNARPAGRIIHVKDTIVRTSQVCKKVYGRGVKAFEIMELNDMDYKERPINNGYCLIRANENEWSSEGMHHMDVHKVNDKLRVYVDGKDDC